MKKISASDLKNKTSETIDLARKEPLQIQKNGKTVAVLMDVSEFERLNKCDDAVWGAAALRAEENGYLSPEESFKALRQMVEGDQSVVAKLHKTSSKLSKNSGSKAASSSKQ